MLWMASWCVAPPLPGWPGRQLALCTATAAIAAALLVVCWGWCYGCICDGSRSVSVVCAASGKRLTDTLVVNTPQHTCCLAAAAGHPVWFFYVVTNL